MSLALQSIKNNAINVAISMHDEDDAEVKAIAAVGTSHDLENQQSN